MTRSIRTFLLAATASAIVCAAPDASAQYQQPPPGYPPPPPPSYQPAPPPPGVYAAPQQPPEPRLQIAAFTGWQVNGDVNIGAGNLAVDDAPSFGVSLWVSPRPSTKIELLWLTSRTNAKIESYTVSYPSSRSFDVDVNYFQLGGVQSIRRGRLEPFLGGTLGAAWYATSKVESTAGAYLANPSDTWRFAITVGGGANVFLTESLAIRLQARMLVPMYFAGGGFYVGTGGSGASVNAGIPAISGDFSVGVAFAR